MGLQIKKILPAILLFFSVLVSAQDIQIAEPGRYNAIADEDMGTRESDLGVPPGTDVSGLVVRDINGNDFLMDQLWAEQPSLIIFYRGGWCPFCNAQIRELSMEYQRFVDAGVNIALISVDKPDASAMMKSTYDIPFPVLSDQDLVAMEAFNVLLDLGADRIEAGRRIGRDYSEWSGRDHQKYAAASSFVVDTSGRVTSATVLKDYTARPSIEQLLAQAEAR